MSNNFERKEFVDVARGLVIILMIIGHSNAPAEIIRGIYGFHMPFFFILSGYIYDVEKWKKLGVNTLIKRRWKAYIIPYFFLSFVNLLINIPVEVADGIHGEALLKSTIKHVFWILYSSGGAGHTPNCIPLWYLPCAFLSCIYLYGLLYVESTNVRILICAVASCIDYVFYYLDVVVFPWHMEVAMLGMVFMYIGVCIKKYQVIEKMENHALQILILMTCGGLCIYTNPTIDLNSNRLNNIIYTYIGSVCISVAVMIFCYHYLNSSKFLSLLGKNTIIIIAFNYAVNTYSTMLWKILPCIREYPYSWWINTVINIICVTIIVVIWRRIKAG